MAVADNAPFMDGFVQAVGPAVVGGFGDESALIDWLEVWRSDDLFDPFPPQPPQHCFAEPSPGFIHSPPSLVQDDLHHASTDAPPPHQYTISTDDYQHTSTTPTTPTPTTPTTPTQTPSTTTTTASSPMMVSEVVKDENDGLEPTELRDFFLQELEAHNVRRTRLMQALEVLNEALLPENKPAPAKPALSPSSALSSSAAVSTRASSKRTRFEAPTSKSAPPAKHTSLCETSLQHCTPPSLRIVDAPERPFPKYAQRNRPVTPNPYVELAGMSFGTTIDLRTFGIYVQVACTDSTPLAGFVGEPCPDLPFTFCFPRLVFPTSAEGSRNRGARVHPGEQKHICFQVRTQFPTSLTASIAQIPAKTASIFLYDHSKWFPSPEISLISNPIVEVGKETEIHVYGQWFISHDDETTSQGRLRITILDMDGVESKVSVVNAKSNHHFSFVYTWSQPCTVWVQVHNDFKHRSSFKTRPSPRRTHRSTILVVPDREAYFNWVRGSPAGGSGADHAGGTGGSGSSSGSGGPVQQQPPSQHQSGSSRRTSGGGGGSGGVVDDDNDGSSPPVVVPELMHAAARHGDLARLQQLLASGGDPFAVDFYGVSALHAAVQFGQVAAVRVMLSALKTRQEQRRLLRLRDSWGLTALHRACLHSDGKLAFAMVCDMLCVESDPYAAYLTADDDFAPLHAALLRGNEAAATLLLRTCWRAKNAVNAPSIDGMSMVHLAVNASLQSLVPPLLRLGCDIDAVDYNGESAIFHAVRQPGSPLVADLLRLGCAIAVSNTAGESILDVAHPSHLSALLRLCELPRPLPASTTITASSSPSCPSAVSDARVKLVGSTLLKITKEQTAEHGERPRSYGRRNLSEPSLNDLLGLDEDVSPERRLDRLDIRIDEDLLKEPIVFDSRPACVEKQVPPSPSPSKRRGSISSPSSQTPAFVPVPSLFSLLSLSPTSKPKKSRPVVDGSASPRDDPPQEKAAKSKKHRGLKALLRSTAAKSK